MLSALLEAAGWLVEKLLRAELRGGLPAKLLWGEAMRAAGNWLRGGAGCGLWCGKISLCGLMLQCYGGAIRADGLVTVAQFAVRADCGPSYCGAGCGLNFK